MADVALGPEIGRGRQPIVSTGRGGAGNILRSPSRGMDPEVVPGSERGREISPRAASGDRVTHAGRGGAGNIRSPSRGKDALYEMKEDALQARLVAEKRGRQVDAPFSSGRGGAGNISGSKSRSRSQARDAMSVNGQSGVQAQGHGRGGFGNIMEHSDADSVSEQKMAAEEVYEKEVMARHYANSASQLHSTGKGGAGNIGNVPPHIDMSQLTLEEKEAYAKVHANDRQNGFTVGKGGAGNVVKPKSHSPGDAERGRGGGMLGNVMRSLSRAAGRDGSGERSKA